MTYKEISSTEWQEFIQDSPQNNLFVSRDFIEATGDKVKFFLVYRKKTPIFGVILPDSDSFFWLAQHSLILTDKEYQKSLRGSYAHSKIVYDFYNEMVFSMYNLSQLSFHHTVKDIRGILWALEKNDIKYQISNDYSGLVMLNAKTNRSSMRNKINYIKDKLIVERKKDCDAQVLIDVLLCGNTLFSEREISKVSKIINHLIECGSGSIHIGRYKDKSEANSAWFVCVYSGVGYILFGGDRRNQYPENLSLTPLVHNEIFNSYRNITHFDFLGINDKNRALYKSAWLNEIVVKTNIVIY